MKRVIIVLLMASLCSALMGCRSHSEYIEIHDDETFSYNGKVYSPFTDSNYSFNPDARMTYIGWTRNFYYKKVDMFLFDDDDQHNFIYIESMSDSLWATDTVTLCGIFDISINKIIAWDMIPGKLEFSDIIIWQSVTDPVLLEDIVYIDQPNEGLNVSRVYSITIYVSSYSYMVYTKVSVYKDSGGYYLRGIEDTDIFYEVKPFYLSIFEYGNTYMLEQGQ